MHVTLNAVQECTRVHHSPLSSARSSFQIRDVFLPVVCVAGGVLVETEELSEFPQGEVALHVLLLVHHTAAQGFLVGLSLQDLLFDCPSLPAYKHARQTQECSKAPPREASRLQRFSMLMACSG